ncbi:hypothetical protein BDW68DRAFT_77324 [Aspergillus falconensis]
MARLNESTASSEPIEILKRRFVRQNREIARVNSIQSLRIRSLESEVSHLLSENVSLREQIITLTQDLERFEAARTLHDGVYDVKARLDSKLVELSSLITELGSLPRRYSRATREKAESAPARQPRQSGSRKEVDDTAPELNLGFDLDGRLPVIMEDKFYPRLTLSAQELQELPDSNTGIPNSPRLEGCSPSPEQTLERDEMSTGAPVYSVDTNTIVDNEEDEHSLPPNLETRRKKKIGPAMIDKEQADTRSVSLLDSKFTRKRGAKRKFSAEDDQSLFESPPSEDDGFQFSRPIRSPKLFSQHAHAPADDDSGELSRPLQSPRLSSQNDHSPDGKKPRPTEMSIAHVQAERKVLEPKSANTNILSPTKPSITKDYNQYHDSGFDKKNENSLPRQGKGAVSGSKNASPKKPSIRTPVFGNDGSKSGKKQGKNGEVKPDTPSLDGIEHSEITATADMPSTRPSRRRGTVVSYAEPNLRDKMRRSTNELGPAVSGDKSRKSTSNTESNREPQDRRNKHASVKKARSSNMANEEHDILGDHALDKHPHRQDTARNNYQFSSYNGSGMDPMNEDEADSVASRKSRRHSSNTKAPGRSIAPNIFTSTLSVESVCNDLVSAYSGTSTNELSAADKVQVRNPQEVMEKIGSMEITRGQRVAARRRSMVL